MSNAVEDFDVYTQIFHYGNRQDFGDNEEASWEAEKGRPTWGDSTQHCWVTVYDDDTERKFHFSWEEVK